MGSSCHAACFGCAPPTATAHRHCPPPLPTATACSPAPQLSDPRLLSRPMLLLSASGTLDTILVLLIVWQILRLVVRVQERGRVGSADQRDDRSKGEVRIERANEAARRPSPGNIEDADFEEIK